MAFRILVECQLCGYEMPVAEAKENGWLQTRSLHVLCPTCAEEVAALWEAQQAHCRRLRGNETRERRGDRRAVPHDHRGRDGRHPR